MAFDEESRVVLWKEGFYSVFIQIFTVKIIEKYCTRQKTWFVAWLEKPYDSKLENFMEIKEHLRHGKKIVGGCGSFCARTTERKWK